MSSTNRYDPSKREHKKTCERSACAEIEPHSAGRHLDQRDELYDGPGIQLRATTMYIRDSARKIIAEAPALMPEVMDMVCHVDWLRDQVTHAHVDRDRGIREASARALDCEAHGEAIRGLETQVHAFDEVQHRAEKGRLALLDFLQAVREVVDKPKEGLTAAELLKALATAVKKTEAAHDRAWKA